MQRAEGERGAALITILLFTALMFILVTTMMGTLGNEIVVSGSHRSSVRALEHAQAGLEEGVRRIEAARFYGGQFPGSICSSSADCSVTIDVVNQQLGPSGGYMEIRSDARVGLSRRRLSQLVLMVVDSMLPNVIYGHDLASQGSAAITGGDVYSQTYVKFKSYPSLGSYTYAGWRIKKLNPGEVNWCYVHGDGGAPILTTECTDNNPGNANLERWYPASRRSVGSGTRFMDAMNWGADDRVAGQVLTFICPNPGPASPVPVVSSRPEFVLGDKKHDEADMLPTEPLYGCTEAPDFLPYTWVLEEFEDDGGNPVRRWFKTIVFEQYRDLYWVFDQTELRWRKKTVAEAGSGPSLLDATYAKYGAVPPFPDFESLDNTYDQYMTGGGNIGGSTPLDFGCFEPDMACPGGRSTPTIVLLDNGDYHINSNLEGHGTLLVDGNLIVNGTFEYWGTVIVNGTLTLGAGTVTIHGGLIARSTAELTGNITVEGGTNIANVPVGQAVVFRRTWWER